MSQQGREVVRSILWAEKLISRFPQITDGRLSRDMATLRGAGTDTILFIRSLWKF
jgi:hypothetical protein